MKTHNIVLAVGVSIISSCGFVSNENTEENAYPHNTTMNYDDEDCTNDPQQQLAQCPMCGGTGIFDYMPGDIYAPKVECPACNGHGMCDINRAQEAMQAIAQANAMMREGGNGYRSGRSTYEIEYDLRRANDLLQSMEEDYHNCSSSVIAAQYPSVIANQKELIRQLEAELRNAQ